MSSWCQMVRKFLRTAKETALFFSILVGVCRSELSMGLLGRTLPKYSTFQRGTRAGSLAALLSAILSFCLSVTLSVCPALCIPSCLSDWHFDILLTSWKTFVLITKLKSQSVFLSVCLSVSVRLSVSLSFYLSDILLTFWTIFVFITKLKSKK